MSKINFSCLKNLDVKGKLQTFVKYMGEYFLRRDGKESFLKHTYIQVAETT